jgi:hypothetical protein
MCGEDGGDRGEDEGGGEVHFEGLSEWNIA